MSEEGERTVLSATPLQELRQQRTAGSREGAARPGDRPAPRLAPDDDIPEPPARERPRSIMVEAAAPLLAMIAGVRSGRLRTGLPELHRRAVDAASRFDDALARGGYDAETRRRARYAVLATVDDVAQNLPGHASEGAEWARRSLVVRAFGENIGGDRFWMLLGEMLSRPADHAELIELYHACLAAGFEGRYRVSAGGRDELQKILDSAYAALPHVRALSSVELVPSWRGSPTPMVRTGFWAPFTLAAAVAAGGLLLLFLVMRLVLAQTGQPAVAALLALNADQPLRLSRPAVAPPPPDAPQQRRLAAFLAPEIAQKLVVVESGANDTRVRTTVGQLFKSGSDVLEPGRLGLFQRIADAVNKEKGFVRIEGHADSDPVTGLAFPDNQSLSAARAERVAQVFRARLADPSRVGAQGFGATQPIASNATAAGKAVNRRVEVVVPRSE